MNIDRKDIDKYLRPWDFPNTLGILEVPNEEIEVLHHLGSGAKACTSKALWRGQHIALKSWDASFFGAEAWSYLYWEICRYCDLESVQGRLVPELLFVSRDSDTDFYMLGLELGEPVSGDEPGFGEAKEALLSDLKKTKWVQREKSFRRLVAIDLESFIPYFGDASNTDNRYPIEAALDLATPERLEVVGLPHISPTELFLPTFDSNLNLRWGCGLNGMRNIACKGIWNGEEVSVVQYRCDAPSRKEDLLAMLVLHASQKKGRRSRFAPKLLFLARQVNGDVLLGLPKGRKVWRTLWLATFFSRLKRFHILGDCIGGNKEEIVEPNKSMRINQKSDEGTKSP